MGLLSLVDEESQWEGAQLFKVARSPLRSRTTLVCIMTHSSLKPDSPLAHLLPISVVDDGANGTLVDDEPAGKSQ